MAFLVSLPVVSRILCRRGLPTRLMVLTLTTRTFHNSSTAVRISVFVESLFTRNVYILLRSTKCVAFSVTCALRITLYTLNALDSSVATIRLPYQQASSHHSPLRQPFPPVFPSHDAPIAIGYSPPHNSPPIFGPPCHHSSPYTDDLQQPTSYLFPQQAVFSNSPFPPPQLSPLQSAHQSADFLSRRPYPASPWSVDGSPNTHHSHPQLRSNPSLAQTFNFSPNVFHPENDLLSVFQRPTFLL